MSRIETKRKPRYTRTSKKKTVSLLRGLIYSLGIFYLSQSPTTPCTCNNSLVSQPSSSTTSLSSTTTNSKCNSFIFVQAIPIPLGLSGWIKRGIGGIQNWVNGEYESSSSSTTTDTATDTTTTTITHLNINEISNMRARDIKRRLLRNHGYELSEVEKMIDKKELINALSYEEHKSWQRQQEFQKRVWIRKCIIWTCVAVLIVMFQGLIFHVLEVAQVNFVVYTDKRRYEISKCLEMKSLKGLFGIFILFLIDILKLWLSTSVILSWVLSSRHSYMFPIPRIPISLGTIANMSSGGGGGIGGGGNGGGHNLGAIGDYGINVGPMVLTYLFSFLTSRVEHWIGQVLAQALKRERKARKKAQKVEDEVQMEKERQERKRAKAARKAEREARRRQAAEAEGSEGSGVAKTSTDGDENGDIDAKTTKDINEAPSDEVDMDNRISMDDLD